MRMNEDFLLTNTDTDKDALDTVPSIYLLQSRGSEGEGQPKWTDLQGKEDFPTHLRTRHWACQDQRLCPLGTGQPQDGPQWTWKNGLESDSSPNTAITSAVWQCPRPPASPEYTHGCTTCTRNVPLTHCRNTDNSRSHWFSCSLGPKLRWLNARLKARSYPLGTHRLINQRRQPWGGDAPGLGGLGAARRG